MLFQLQISVKIDEMLASERLPAVTTDFSIARTSQLQLKTQLPCSFCVFFSPHWNCNANMVI